MTSSTSVVQIANLSLLSIGARAQISSLTEGSTEANAVATLYAFVFEQLARSANWNCLRRQATLTLLAAAPGTPENPDGTTLPVPPTPYLYSYAEPSDSLQIRFLMPVFPTAVGGSVPISPSMIGAASIVGSDGAVPFTVAYSTDNLNNPITIILTDQIQAQAVYTVNQSNPVIFDSLFTSAFVASMAAYLVPALALDKPLMQLAIRNADMIIAQARTRDGDEGWTSQNREADWMRARNTGYGTWSNYGSGMGVGYSAMCWPQG